MTTPKPSKGKCAACNRSVPLVDGKTSNHGKRGRRCDGSGNPPKRIAPPAGQMAAVMAAPTKED